MTTQPTATSCTHYWLLGDRIPGQAPNQGTCKLCGITKPFRLSIPDITYQEIQHVVRAADNSVIKKYMMERMDREI